jgi:hypothetical protein
MGSATYGGATNTWGQTWTEAQINSTGFGVTLSALNESGFASRTASVDYIRITVAYTPATAPTVTSPTATSIGSTTATLGANVTSNGGATLTARGTCWGTTAAPATNCTDEGGTATGVFTQARTGLTAGTQIYYRGYATNLVGTSYSSDGSFYTEPATQASAITFSSVAPTTMTVGWTRGDGDGVIVLMKSGSAITGVPADGTYTTYTANAAYGSGTQITDAYVIYKGAGTSVSVTGLTAGTTYSVAAYEFKGMVDTSGVAQGTNYKATPATANQGSDTVLTVTGPSSVTYGATGTLTSSGGLGGALSYSAGASTGCDITGGTTLNVSDASGTCNVTATRAASDPYAAQTSASFGVTLIKATPTATLAVTNSPVVYDGSAHAAAVGITASSVPGSVSNVLTGGAATQTNAGTYAVTADFVPTDAANYNSLTGLAAGNFVIDKATPTVTVTNTPVTYDGLAHAATAACSGGGAASNISTGGAATQTNAGSYTVTADCAESANYNAATGVTAVNSFVIAKATPTATLAVTNSPVVYDGLPHAAAVGITASSVPGSVGNILTGGAATQTAVGTYAVTADFVPADSANYNTVTGLSAGNFVIASPTIYHYLYLPFVTRGD